MRSIIIAITLVCILSSCKKEETDPYEKPWDTQYISYKSTECGEGGWPGYAVYYKDSLLFSDCHGYGGHSIEDHLRVNESIMHLFMWTDDRGISINTTRDGGCSWTETQTEGRRYLKYHFVANDIIYCITHNEFEYSNKLWITGVGQSNLVKHELELVSGTQYLTDLGTNILDLNSTTIILNDSARLVIYFN